VTELEIVPRAIRAQGADAAVGQAAISAHASECLEAGLVSEDTASLLADVFALVLDADDETARGGLRDLRARAALDPKLASTLRDMLARLGHEPFGSQVALLRLIDAQDNRIASLEAEVRDLNQDVQSGRSKRRAIERSARKHGRLRFFEGVFFGAMALILVVAALLAFTGVGATLVPLKPLL
jgi:hypothetical protein